LHVSAGKDRFRREKSSGVGPRQRVDILRESMKK
jgi:hypothetical protein